MSAKIAAINWFTAVYSLVLTAMCVVSCAGVGSVVPDPVKPIQSALTTTTNVSKGITKNADSIDQHVIAVRKATPEPLIPQIGPHLDGINHDTDELRGLKGQLDAAQASLVDAKKQANALQDLSRKQADRIAKLEEEKKSALHQLMVWVILLSVVGVGVAGSLVYTGNMWGISLGFGCLITLGLAIFITQYSMWFAIGAAALCVLGLGYVVYQLVIRKKAATELVQTVEADKQAMSDPARLHLFGNGAIPGHVDLIQSESTKKFVAKTRSKKGFRLAPSAKAVNLTGND